MDRLLLAPNGKGATLFELTRDAASGAPQLLPRRDFAMPPFAPHVLDPEADALIYWEHHRERVSRVVVARGLSQQGKPDVTYVHLPDQFAVHAMALRHGV